MAARKVRIRHSEEIRAKIQASQLINRLQAHIAGKITLSTSQVKGIEILLRKSLPDLTSVEMSADMRVAGEIGLRPLLTREQWLALHQSKS